MRDQSLYSHVAILQLLHKKNGSRSSLRGAARRGNPVISILTLLSGLPRILSASLLELGRSGRMLAKTIAKALLSSKCTAILIAFICCTHNSHGFSLMLDPAGDAKNSGRTLSDNFERGVTLQFTEQLKKLLELALPDLRIILTRFPGESIEPLQNANFANRLNVDLYVSINFYHESETKPQLYAYYVSYGDDFITQSYDLCFYPYDQAHRINSKKTRNLISTLQKSLAEKKYTRLYDFKGCFGLPFKPLIGIKAPAIALEMSVKNSQNWHSYVQPIANALAKVIEEYDT